jgi:hypothetical protein
MSSRRDESVLNVRLSFGLLGAAGSTTVTYALAALVLVALCSRTPGVPMWS